MRLHGLHSVPLGPLLAGVYAVVPIAGVVRETAGNAHFILTWAASFCVGVVATMGLRYGLIHGISSRTWASPPPSSR